MQLFRFVKFKIPEPTIREISFDGNRPSNYELKLKKQLKKKKDKKI